MRSPWLSREYEKSTDVVVNEVDGNYELKNINTNASLLLSKVEYDKYENNLFNEIEWEKLYLKGLAVDKNCDDLIIDSSFDVSNKKFIKSKNVENFSLKVGKHKFQILINPELGSWMALTEEEYGKYKKDDLTQEEWLSLFIRGLADDEEHTEVDFDFPVPADYPSVIVVNITTGCNLRCKYCFADCGPFKGENMTEDVMDATIDRCYGCYD